MQFVHAVPALAPSLVAVGAIASLFFMLRLLCCGGGGVVDAQPRAATLTNAAKIIKAISFFITGSLHVRIILFQPASLKAFMLFDGHAGENRQNPPRPSFSKGGWFLLFASVARMAHPGSINAEKLFLQTTAQ